MKNELGMVDWMRACFLAANEYVSFTWPKDETYTRAQMENAFYDGAAWEKGLRSEFNRPKESQ